MNEDDDSISSAQSAYSKDSESLDNNSESDFKNLVIELNDFDSYNDYIHSMNMRKTCQTHGWQTVRCKTCEINLNKKN
jgi:hypothetical protein